MGDDLVLVDVGGAVLEDFGDGRDGVLGGVDVVDGSCLGSADHLNEFSERLGARRRVGGATKLAHHATSVNGRLPHLGRSVLRVRQKRLNEKRLVPDTCGAAEFNQVVKHAQRPLTVRPRHSSALKHNFYIRTFNL